MSVLEKREKKEEEKKKVMSGMLLKRGNNLGCCGYLACTSSGKYEFQGSERSDEEKITINEGNTEDL